MSKVLVSWVGTVNDFTSNRLPVNPSGPSSLVHKYFWNYDKHYLLSQEKKTEDAIKLLHLAAHLRKSFQHNVIEIAMAIDDIINVDEIIRKVSTFLLSLKEDDIDIFISTGTPSMQVAWYFAHENLKLKTKLFQLRRPEQTNSKDEPEQVWVNLTQSIVPTALLIREELKNKKNDINFLITKTLVPIYELAEKVAAADKVSVMILGETGTGKEGLARYIHKNSPRSKGPFVAVNCAAMGESLLESRLFGHAPGSFTGAGKGAKGYFEFANTGTIFLDEIGDISPYMQQTLLRVLQEKEIVKVGETETRKINVRVIAATNRNLIDLCSKGKFRWDLYYRLSVVDLTLPSLKEMGVKETEELFDFILKKKMGDFGTSLPKISNTVRKKIFSYPFPGNIRELENFIERLYATNEGEITEKALPKNFTVIEKEHSLKLQDVITQHVNNVYLMCDKNIVRTAKILDVAQGTVRSKLNIK